MSEITYPNGKPILQGTNEDVNIERLVQAFVVIDKRGKRWVAPEGMRTDGASIPEALEPIVGDPFAGVTKPAAVIHDHYCVIKSRSQKETHRIFYELVMHEMKHNKEYGWFWRFPWNNKIWQYSRAWFMLKAIEYHNRKKNPNWK